MASISSDQGYTGLPGNDAAVALGSRVTSCMGRNTKFYLIAGSAFIAFVLNAAGLGAPWLSVENSSSSGTYTTTTTLTKWTSSSCPAPSFACTTISGTTAGVAKAGGDAAIGLLTLCFLLLLSILASTVGIIMSLNKGATIGKGPLTRLGYQVLAVTLLTYSTVIAYPAAVVPSTGGFPGAQNTTVSYGGGFAVIIVNCFLTVGMLLLVQSLLEDETSVYHTTRTVPSGPPSPGGYVAAASPPHTEVVTSGAYTGAAFRPEDVATKQYSGYADAGASYQSGGYQGSS